MTDYLDARQRDKLKAHCKWGRLFDAQRLLEEHGTCRLRKTKKWTPLYMSVSRGFHSLVEVLLRYDHAQWDLKKSYIHALRQRRQDLATMILACPHWSEPIDPVDALASGDIGLIRSLIDRGLNLHEGDCVCQAAMRNPSGVLNAISELGLPLKEFDEQLHCAMVSLVHRENTWLASRLLRAGLDARRPSPYYDDRGKLCEAESALSLAIYTHKPGFLASLRPDPVKDDEVDLIRAATFLGDDKALKILTDAGFRLNCKANGGSPAIDQVLAGQALGCLTVHPVAGYQRSAWGYSGGQKRGVLQKLKDYFEMGAKWAPDTQDSYHLRCVRDTLLALGEAHAAELIGMLIDNGALEDDIRILFKSARMKPLAEQLQIGRNKSGARGRRSSRSA